jgi:Holliday junction resolvasome RuvABC endonuclease subunit
MVAPKDWKKQVIGFGNANKDQVSEWLRNTHPTFHASCTSQDGIDSICIGLSAQALLAGRR